MENGSLALPIPVPVMDVTRNESFVSPFLTCNNPLLEVKCVMAAPVRITINDRCSNKVEDSFILLLNIQHAEKMTSKAHDSVNHHEPYIHVWA